MNHYRKINTNRTSIKTWKERSYEGESIERQIERLLTSGEKIESISPLLYTDRKDGVLPETNIRTDKMEIARKAMGEVSKSYLAKRQQYMKLDKTNVNPNLTE